MPTPAAPKAPKAASSEDIDKWLKQGPSPAAPSAAPAPEGGSDRYQGILGSGPLEGVQRGIAKEASSLGVNAARLANRGVGLASPELRKSLGELAESVPGVKRLESFADAPYEGIGERIGGIGFDLAGGGAVGELGVGSKIAQGANALRPTMMPVFSGGRVIGFKPTTWGKVAGAASTGGEAAAKGAIGGAIQDPEHPVHGAEVGAAVGAAIPAAGKALRSGTGQFMGGTMARAIPTAAMHAMTGGGSTLFHLARHGLTSYHSPTGHWLQRFGRRVFDKAGRMIGFINPMTGGFIAGEEAGGGGGEPYPEPSGGPGEGSPYGPEDLAPPGSVPVPQS